MPIKHAALKQIRKDRKRALRNHAVHSELKTLKKRLHAFLLQQKPDEARALLPLLMKRFDQAATKGIIHKNTASRNKTRLTRQLGRSRPPVTNLPASKRSAQAGTAPRSAPPAPPEGSSVQS